MHFLGSNKLLSFLVFVCERERECLCWVKLWHCVCVREGSVYWVKLWLCVCVCERERQRGVSLLDEVVAVCLRERERGVSLLGKVVTVCMCV